MIQTFKKALFAGLFLSVASLSHAAVYDIDQSHSQVGFKIRHLVSKTGGVFKSYAGSVNYDEAKPETLSVEATIQTTSVDTNEPKRDEHLRTADFFNVEKFPTMTFKSTKTKKVKAGVWQITGDLTLLGVTKPVVLDVDGGEITNDPWGNTRVGFSAKTKINRKDWGMVYNKVLDKGALMVGEEVEISIEIEGIKKK